MVYLLDQYREEVAELISGTVARWDADDASRRIELQVGRDLQYIRINGTVVGGLAGLVIFTARAVACSDERSRRNSGPCRGYCVEFDRLVADRIDTRSPTATTATAAGRITAGSADARNRWLPYVTMRGERRRRGPSATGATPAGCGEPARPRPPMASSASTWNIRVPRRCHVMRAALEGLERRLLVEAVQAERAAEPDGASRPAPRQRDRGRNARPCSAARPPPAASFTPGRIGKPEKHRFSGSTDDRAVSVAHARDPSPGTGPDRRGRSSRRGRPSRCCWTRARTHGT